MIKEAALAGVELPAIRRFMQAKGYRWVGDGVDGSAWGNGKHVLKVMSQKYAKPYLTFVQYALKHPNKHYPKFYGYRTDIEFGSLRLASVKMELLKPLTPLESLDAYDIYDLAQYSLSHPPDLDLSQYSTILRRHESLIEAIAALIKVGIKYKDLTFDHENSSGNVMKRGDTWVIIDPLISSKARF